MTLPDRLGALARVAHVLDALEITYVVGGSVASTRWGIPRYTNDIDVVLELLPNKIVALVGALEPGFYVDESSVRDAVRLNRAFNIIARDDFTKVDMFVADDQPWQLQQFARRRLEHLPPEISPYPVFIASPEDTILAKLLWFEKGNRVSSRQWQDVRGVLNVQGATLDIAYVRLWAVHLGVRDLLDEALVQAADGGDE